MNTQTASQIARHLRQVFTGGNWTSVNLKDTLHGIHLAEALAKPGGCNSIAVLVFHIHYYVSAISRVLNGQPLDAHDRFSFDLPELADEAAWLRLQESTLEDALTLAGKIEMLSDQQLHDVFVEEKYGTMYRNLHGLIEHTHYHLGQISLLKKMIPDRSTEVLPG